MPKKRRPRISVIGGGTGTYVTLSGLKKYRADLTAVISVADSGGSTGRLRDEFGFLPVGDLRQALAALAVDDQHEWIRKLLLYRFTKGSGLEGHNLGNLILTALQDMTGSTTQALEIAHSIFRLDGKIYPVTDTNIQLVIEYADGTVEIGESVLDTKHGGERITSVTTSPKSVIYEKARQAILQSDIVCIGPGDLYGSLLPNLVIEGVADAFSKTKAKIIYTLNLMTRYTQTHNYKASDHIKEIELRIGRKIDYIIVSNSTIPSGLRERYAQQHEYPVIDDLDDVRYTVIRDDLLRPIEVDVRMGDAAPCSFIRHDPDKLAYVIMKLS